MALLGMKRAAEDCGEKIQAEEDTPREDQPLAKSGPNVLSSESF